MAMCVLLQNFPKKLSCEISHDFGRDKHILPSKLGKAGLQRHLLEVAPPRTDHLAIVETRRRAASEVASIACSHLLERNGRLNQTRNRGH